MSRSAPHHLSLVSTQAELTDALWHQLRREAEAAQTASPTLAPLFLESILNQPDFPTAAFHRIAARLRNDTISHSIIFQAFQQASRADAALVLGLKADIAAVFERDPACERLIEPFLYFKGFHAIQLHRLNHWLWKQGERDLALYLQSRASEVFQADIHPAARIGRGILLDHATGLVIGETAEIGDDVSLLQGVTLGGTGKEAGDRHPKIRRGVIIGAGAKILGNIEVGEDARIAAGSVVLAPVPPRTTVAGVPARPVRMDQGAASPRSADEILAEMAYTAFDYTI
ncbi:serine O-acetyltransferase [Roseomonas sp. KE0001]|uniref:serine O-acetyltransferase n=1 Tax=unclassified Roseomonas TaxID=2617492 RepID=UPI0018DFE40F|nr:serine O-acetyltransferase [Roseomonas sp. KE0001]MBI0434640.1 serine O-acetyltransferase [Roseomonas sp. KE0001]